MKAWKDLLAVVDRSPLIWALVAFLVVLAAPSELKKEAFSFILGAVTARIRSSKQE
jgi:hypothetical protein